MKVSFLYQCFRHPVQLRGPGLPDGHSPTSVAYHRSFVIVVGLVAVLALDLVSVVLVRSLSLSPVPSLSLLLLPCRSLCTFCLLLFYVSLSFLFFFLCRSGSTSLFVLRRCIRLVGSLHVVPPPGSFLACEAVQKNTNKRARTATIVRHC